MRIAAISDLHIGPAVKSDPFRHVEEAFLRRLDALERHCDRIVLLGDIWQCDHGLVPGAAAERAALDTAMERTRRLSDRWAKSPYVLVAGNHDAITAEALGALDEHVVEADGFRVVFQHGHTHDPVIGTAPRTSAASTWAMGRLRAARLNAVAAAFEEMDVEVKHRRLGGEAGPYGRAAVDLIERRNADAVVFGHTHRQVLQAHGDGVLANTGTCSRGRFMGVLVDTAARSVRLWTDAPPRP